MKTGKRIRGSLLAFALLLLLAAGSPLPPAAAQLPSLLSQGITITETTTSSGMMGRGGGTTTATLYFGGNAMKRASSDGTDSIILLDQGKIVSVDNNKKTYSEMTFEQMQQVLEEASASMGQDPEAAAAMRKMMGQISSQITVTKQGPGGEIAGYATEKYLVTGFMEMEMWAAPDLKVPTAYYDVLKFRTPSNPMFDLGQLYDEMKKIDGLTLKSVMTIKVMNMSMTTTTEATSVQKGAVPPSIFEIPAGYKKVEQKF